jgi:hypothetical protein
VWDTGSPRETKRHRISTGRFWRKAAVEVSLFDLACARWLDPVLDMDCTECAEKAKHNQNLSMVAVSYAVPNAVLTIFK